LAAQRALEQETAVDADGVNAVILGLVGWAAAALTLRLFFYDDLRDSGATWWLWVCVTGFGLGLLGLPYVVRRRRAYRRHGATVDTGESLS
jgi:hypothetical protein